MEVEVEVWGGWVGQGKGWVGLTAPERLGQQWLGPCCTAANSGK